ncbi:11527_t:CDS:2, partial [Acaulospora colombiana]
AGLATDPTPELRTQDHVKNLKPARHRRAFHSVSTQNLKLRGKISVPGRRVQNFVHITSL